MPKTKASLQVLEDRTATGAVLDFVFAHGGSIITAKAVADSLGLDQKVTATLLSRLAREGKLVKLDRGRYSSSRNIRTSKPQKPLMHGGEDNWRKAFDAISIEMARALGPAAMKRLQGTFQCQGLRERTEGLIAFLRQELGDKLALDMIQPIFETIFGDSGRAAAIRLCIPKGGAGA
jgi:hypothetical protein